MWAALVVAGAEGATAAEVAAAAVVAPAVAARALRRLGTVGLAVGPERGHGPGGDGPAGDGPAGDGPVGDGGRWRADVGPLVAAGHLGSRLRVEADPGADAPTPEEAAVLRAYLAGGRLRSVPAVRRKRLVVLDWLAQRFEPGRTYPEDEVNQILGEHHPDHALLRRFLVDEGLMARRGGFYWRSGGTFDI